MNALRENKVSLQESRKGEVFVWAWLPVVPRHITCKSLHRKTEAHCLTALPCAVPTPIFVLRTDPRSTKTTTKSMSILKFHFSVAYYLLSVSWPFVPMPACWSDASLGAHPALVQFYQAKQRCRWDLSSAAATAAVSVSSKVYLWGLELGWAPTYP